MTVIFGTTFVGGAVVGADQKRHYSDTKLDAGRVKKTVVLSRFAVATKAGIGPDADYIYDLVRAEIDGRDAGAHEVADIIERLAPEVLTKCRANGTPTDTPLQFVVAGLTGDIPTIHAIQTNIPARTDAKGPGKPMAFGMRHETNERAVELVYPNSQRVFGRPMLDVGRWAAAMIADEQIEHNYAVDYPLDIARITSNGVDERTFASEPPASSIVIQILNE
jgi:hypothetical protein